MNMNQIKFAGESFSNEVARDAAAPESNLAGADNEIRQLRDLEMVLAAGGADGVPCW
jgi:hypothetical protein